MGVFLKEGALGHRVLELEVCMEPGEWVGMKHKSKVQGFPNVFLE